MYENDEHPHRAVTPREGVRRLRVCAEVLFPPLVADLTRLRREGILRARIVLADQLTHLPLINRLIVTAVAVVPADAGGRTEVPPTPRESCTKRNVRPIILPPAGETCSARVVSIGAIVTDGLEGLPVEE